MEVTTPTEAPRTWREVGSRVQCDTSNGEVFMFSSPSEAVPNLDECKQLCEDTEGCQSITYFKSGWCSHFSTPCTNTKKNNKAVAFQLIEAGHSFGFPHILFVVVFLFCCLLFPVLYRFLSLAKCSSPHHHVTSHHLMVLFVSYFLARVVWLPGWHPTPSKLIYVSQITRPSTL